MRSNSAIRNSASANRPKNRVAKTPGAGGKLSKIASAWPIQGPKPGSVDCFPVVAIGASAGGLEAFTQLLDELPEQTGMAFVLVQHLDPTRESVLGELIGRKTKIPVKDVRDGMKAQPNHIYVMPPNVSMGFDHGTFKLAPRKDDHKGRLPIDTFMRSLAEERKSRAIGVVLSGTATDGTLGAAALKSEGGIVFAEDPKSAAFDGMPRSVIASGCVDYVLPPDRIAHELVRISRHPYVNHVKEGAAPAEAAPAETYGGMGRILGLLQKSSGVDFRQYKPNTIHRRTMRRMLLRKVESIEEYARYLRTHHEEAEALYNDILIPVTHFFRDPDAFEALKSKVYPAIVKDKSNQGHIRFWAPGCSTGEETYSLAMTLLEFFGDKAASFQVQVFGSDVSEKGIAKARAGVYPEAIAQDVSPERLRRFFVKVEEGYRVNKAVREMCIFARQDVTADPPFSQMNLVACRNLLIYLEPELQKKVLPILHYALKPAGFLFLGHSESAAAFPHLFAPVDKAHRIFAKRASATRVHYDFSTTHYPVETGMRAPAKIAPVRAVRGSELQVAADQVVLRDYAPAGVIVNDAMEILHFRGRTNPYLEQAPGKASLNVLKLARKELAAELRKAISKARGRGVTARAKDVAFKQHGRTGFVDLSVVPLAAGDPAEIERSYLVLFEEPVTVTGEKGKTGKAKAQGRGRESMRLKRELEAAQEGLRSAAESEEALREEFQSANEEVLSANEELQSTNEELETSKEELQSSNEELNTVNDELNHRNQDLNQLNSDLTNLMNSTRIPVVMLDAGLRIRRFTSTAEALLKVKPADIGRPITDIRLNIRISDLDRMIHEVMDSLHASEHEVQDGQEHWYSLQIHPYRTLDNRIDGVVLALLDVDAIKKSNEQLRRSTEFFRAIISTVREPLLVLDADLRVIAANDSFLKTFQASQQDTVKSFLYRLGNEQWNIPKLRAMLEQVLPQSREVRDFEVEHDFPAIGRRIMLLNAHQMFQANEQNPMILLAIEDVTERRLAAAALVKSEKLATAARLAASLAHEINNPLQSVSNLMTLLRRHEGLDKEAHGYATLAEKELSRVVHLIRQSLGFYRESTSPAAVEISELIGTIVELCAKEIEGKGVKIVKQYESTGTIHSFAGEIRQIVTALLVNALEASKEGGVITLRAAPSRNWRDSARPGIRISVSDTGAGISTHTLPHIFEPFFTTKGENGTGLGLWVTHGIVNRLGGSIRVRSSIKPGRSGTCFSVFLPDESAQAKRGSTSS